VRKKAGELWRLKLKAAGGENEEGAGSRRRRMQNKRKLAAKLPKSRKAGAQSMAKNVLCYLAERRQLAKKLASYTALREESMALAAAAESFKPRLSISLETAEENKLYGA